MGTVHLLEKRIKIIIYNREHNPPHLHAEYSGEVAVLRIKDGFLMKGQLPKRELKVVRKWLSDPEVKTLLTEMFHSNNPMLRR